MDSKTPKKPSPAPLLSRNGKDLMGSSDFEILPPWEEIPETSLHERLLAAGIELPPTQSLGDAELSAKLSRVIEWMADHQTFLSSTDHLSDRELYRHLIEEVFQEPMKDFESILPPAAAARWQHHIDLVSSGSDEDIQNYLRYYCNDEERETWRRDFPDIEIPPKEKPPYDRDRFLPGSADRKE
ncbi:MAG: hypothetical protein RL885_10560 [Planctomycetota bacterium]